MKEDINNVISIIKETISIDEGVDISSNTEISSLGINSLNFLKIIVEIEEAYDIEFDDNELNFDYFNTIESVVKLIDSKTKNRN